MVYKKDIDQERQWVKLMSVLDEKINSDQKT